MKADFGGWATKHALVCTDGRTITPEAFKHQDGQVVTLVWQHDINTPENILGHARLTHSDGGVYAHCFLNDNPRAVAAGISVQHKDIKSLSIRAGHLKQRGKEVMHGLITEVSLVLAGANPGAVIDNLSFQHSDGTIESDTDEATIYTGLELEFSHAEDTEAEAKKEAPADSEGEDDDRTVQDVYDTLDEDQKKLVSAMIAQAITNDSDLKQSDSDDETDDDDSDDITHQEKEGSTVARNVFQNSDEEKKGATLSHAQVGTIIGAADTSKGLLSDSVLSHAGDYGIDDIDILFPDARNVTGTPDWIKRRTEWVANIIGGAHKTPFSRIKSMSADITLDSARAKGYVKGTMKKTEFFGLAFRITTPKTIYKKQKLDRDDIIDITSFDVVVWIKGEMRIMLEEEIARAILIGDGREVDDPDKIDETHIRPIATDHTFYTHRINVAANTGGVQLVETVLRARKHYKGSGGPAFYTDEDTLTDMLLAKDRNQRRLYRTVEELAAEMRVSTIIPVEVMEGFVDETGHRLLGVMVNIKDYTIGADKGGETTFFDQFDIDFNQEKYLYETRMSGALTKPKSAIAFWSADGTEVTPAVPTYVSGTNTVTIPATTGAVYSLNGDIVTAGDTVIAEDSTVEVAPDTGYYFPAGQTVSWTFVV